MWLYALHFVLCKVIVDEFSKLYFKLFFVQVYLVPLLLNGIGKFLAFVTAFFETSFYFFITLS